MEMEIASNLLTLFLLSKWRPFTKRVFGHEIGLVAIYFTAPRHALFEDVSAFVTELLFLHACVTDRQGTRAFRNTMRENGKGYQKPIFSLFFVEIGKARSNNVDFVTRLT